MRDQDKSKDDLISELVSLRNKLNAIQFAAAKKDFQSAQKEKEEEALRRLREFSAWVVFSAPAVLCQLSADGTTIFVNPFAEKITGYKAEDLLGKNFWRLLFPGDDFQQTTKLFRAVEKGDVRDYDMTLVTKAGHRCTIAFHSLNRYAPDGKLTEIILVGMDVSARKRVEAQLAQNEIKYRTLVDNIPNAVYRASHTARWSLLHVSDFIKKITGRDAWDFIDNRILSYGDILEPEDKMPAEALIREALLKGEAYELDYRIRHADGSVRWVHDKGRGSYEEGRLLWVDGVITDITDKKNMQKKLEETLEQVKNLSLTDELTKLYNRRGFVTHAEHQMLIAERSRRLLTIIFVDLNGMKGINDKLGHETGDLALVETANILRATFRKADIVARLGGDEFAVLAVESDDDSSQVMIDRLQSRVAEFNLSTSRPFKLSMSTGVSQYDPQNPRGIDELLKSADEKMYEMKREMKRNS
ncbi:MAG: diguanylate cyclase [Candidatus Omnitrophica bacterium]|nr:diguanylate cyclase [Candidatus Omnitrophota bacterium]